MPKVDPQQVKINCRAMLQAETGLYELQIFVSGLSRAQAHDVQELLEAPVREVVIAVATNGGQIPHTLIEE